MKFTVIDVETANADISTICQVGIARFENMILQDEWVSYIDPEDYFDGINISIHGIDEEKVNNAPNFKSISQSMYDYMDDTIVVCHTHFDRLAIKQACNKYSIREPHCKWLDSARVARRTWDKFSQKGYGLHNVCEFLGYKFEHHDALEDAKAAGKIIIEACKKSDLDIEDWLKRVELPIDSDGITSINRNGNPDGSLYGEVLVFTGALQIPRRNAADYAAKVGCKVTPSVTKKTTILVVGDQDIQRLAGHKKSSKHRKVEELILKGQKIKILRESDFLSIAEKV